MPRITETQLRIQANRRRQERVQRIIMTAARAQDMDLKELSARTGIGYQSLCKKVRGDTGLLVEDAATIANALKMDEQTRAALLGSPKKCRYETGYSA